MPSILFAQIYVDGVDINADDEIQYCQVSGVVGFRKIISVTIDYGQVIKSWRKMKIGDKNEKNITFNSMVHVLNFMDKNGWELIDSFFHPEQEREKYTFKKKKKNE